MTGKVRRTYERNLFYMDKDFHKTLPYPLVEWSDYYQSMAECAKKISDDFRFMRKLKKLHDWKENHNVDEQ